MTPEDIASLEEKLSDPVWRLTSGELYKIAPADGTGLQPFRPRPEQVAVIKAIHVEGKKRIMIPKARRLGMSTVLGLIMLDFAIWHRNKQCSLIDQNAADATRKLDTIMKVALENLPEWLACRITQPKSNDSQLSIDLEGAGKSDIYAGMNARGGSNDMLWVSEWGVIQFEDAKRSAKIRAGALPSARHGITVIETTWAGGKGGDVWELIEPVLNGQSDDWHIMFFPWFIDPRNVSDTAVIDDIAVKHFAKLADRMQASGIVLSEPQRRWWAQERRTQGIFMARENPTFLDDCWSAPVKGAIFAEEIERARAEGRICRMPVHEGALVYTTWDLGAPQNMCVWYWQITGREIRVIDCDIGDFGTLTQRVAHMNRKPYSYGKHFIPHDAEQTERTGETFHSAIIKAGLSSNMVSVIPRIHSVWIGINHAKELFSAMSFRSPECDRGIDALIAYRTKVTGDGALQTNEPVHDWASHIADPFRYIAEAHRAGLVSFKYTEAQPRPDYYDPRKRLKRVAPIRVS